MGGRLVEQDVDVMARWPGMGRVIAAAFVILAIGRDAAARDVDPYPHKGVVRREYGEGPRAYWLFEPTEPRPAGRVPLIVFNHGWLCINPATYGGWIDHLTRSGNIVVFPRYQIDAFTRPADFLPNAIASISDAIDVLQTGPGHVRPDLRRFAVIGHSAGGNLSAHLAAVSDEVHLPRFRAVIVMMPGEVTPLREPTLDRIPGDTLLVVAAGEEDRIVGDARAREIFAQATSIPPSRKKYILYRTDLHGTPRLIAHHGTPAGDNAAFDSGDVILPAIQRGSAEINAFDRAGFWSMADLTLRAAFDGQTLDAASRRGDAFRHLGFWSDGRQVTPPIVSDDLSQVPRVYPTNGFRIIKWGSGNVLSPGPRPLQALSERAGDEVDRR